LLITDGVSGDQIDIRNDLESTPFQVQTIAFADGSSMNLNGGLALTAADSDGSTLNALSGSDTLIASAGGQTLNGKGGVYDFGLGDGADTIVNNGLTFGPSGQLVFGSGVADDQIWIDQVDNSGNVSSTGNNLRFDILGTSDSITVDNWYGSTSSQLSSATLSGSGLTIDAQLASLVQAMASFESSYQASTGTAFDPTATANSTITNSTLLAAVNSAWHH
jgi:Haemolysin-type calcium binding protein related domain